MKRQFLTNKEHLKKPVLLLVVFLLLVGGIFGLFFIQKAQAIQGSNDQGEARQDPRNQGPKVPPGSGNSGSSEVDALCGGQLWPLVPIPAGAPGYEIGGGSPDGGTPVFVQNVYHECFGPYPIPGLEENKGGFGHSIITMTVYGLPSTLAQIKYATETGPLHNDRGWILSYAAVWDEDPDKNPNGFTNFPGGCNIIHFRRRIPVDPLRYRDEIRLSSLECNYETDDEDFNPNVVKEYFGQPEPDSDANPQNDYQGTMDQETKLEWYRDKDSNQTGALTGHRASMDFKWIIPYPGLLYKHLTPPGAKTPQGYRTDVVGLVGDGQRKNGKWDAADCGTATSGESQLLDPSQPEGPSNPNTIPCPIGVPFKDFNGVVTWTHDEPYTDSDGDNHYDSWEDANNDGICQPLTEDVDGDGDCSNEEFRDIGNGYTPGDFWFYEDGFKSELTVPELAWSRQFVDIGTSPRVETVGDRHVPFMWDLGRTKDGITEGEPKIYGEFETFSGRECFFEPGMQCPGEEPPVYDNICGVCGENQKDPVNPSLGGTFCEDKSSRKPTTVWPPITANTLTFLQFLISPPVFDNVFDSVIGESTPSAQIDLRVVPISPEQGAEVSVSAVQQGFSSQQNEMYFAWLLDSQGSTHDVVSSATVQHLYPQQGLAAGASTPVPDHRFAPPTINTDTGQPQEDLRDFYKPPVRLPREDQDHDGMDDDWERHYQGMQMQAGEDPDFDGYVAKDYHNIKNPESFIRITPGVWNTKGTTDEAQWQYIDGNAENFTNVEEYTWGTNPLDPDTDDDGFRDGVDIAGVGQWQLNLTNEKGSADPRTDIPWQKVGIIAMGKSGLNSQKEQQTFTEITCRNISILPENRQSFDITLSADTKNPAPGKEVEYAATVASADLREGYLTYDWKITGPGGQVLTEKSGAQGESSLFYTLPVAGQANYINPGDKITVSVTAKGRLRNQTTFGEEASASVDYYVGNEDFILQATQNGKPLALTNGTQVSNIATNGIPVDRQGNVTVTFADLGDPNATLNGQYFIEWTANDQYIVEQSGLGKVNFTFDPQSFLKTPDAATDNPSKESLRVKIKARVVDSVSQKEVMRLEQLFNVKASGIEIAPVPAAATNGGVVLEANTASLAVSQPVLYRWEDPNGTVLAEGTDQKQLRLSAALVNSMTDVRLTVAEAANPSHVLATADYALTPEKGTTSLWQRAVAKINRIVPTGLYAVKFIGVAIIVFAIIFFVFRSLGIFKSKKVEKP